MLTTPGKRSRIAVIAVHGVGDHARHQTAQTAADMLARSGGLEAVREERPGPAPAAALPVTVVVPLSGPPEASAGSAASPTAAGTPLAFYRAPEAAAQERGEDAAANSYPSFEEHELRISVVPVPVDEAGVAEEVSPLSTAKVLKNIKAKFRHQSLTAAARLSSAPTGDARRFSRRTDAALDYMAEQLSAYEVGPAEAVYETLRLESTRTASKTRVDVFEMYWADLSRFAGSWLRWFLEFYQLLFFLNSLGRRTFEFARVAHERPAKDAHHWLRWAWPAFGGVLFIAEQALAVLIPVLNLYLLGIGSGLLPLLLPGASIPWVAGGFAGLVAAGLGGWIIYRRRETLAQGGRPWPWRVLVPMAVGGVSTELVWLVTPNYSYLWLQWLWSLLPFLVITWAMRSYQNRRPGAFPLGLIGGIAVTLLTGYEVWCFHGDARSVVNALLRAAEWTVLGLEACWIVLLSCAFVATLIGFLIPYASVRRESDEDTKRDRKALARAVWTANLCVVVPTLIVIILNVTLWQTLIYVALPSGPTTAEADRLSLAGKTESGWNPLKTSALWQSPHQPVITVRGKKLLTPRDVHHSFAWEVVRELMAQSYTPFYSLICMVPVVAMLLTVWMIIPAVIGEWLPPNQDRPRDQPEKASWWLGENLSAAFRGMRWAGEFVRWTVFALPLAFLADFIWFDRFAPWFEGMLPYNEAMLLIGVWFVLAFVAARGPFGGFGAGLRAILNIALDVINWLRLHPRRSNPRARICARYYSLLHHIETWRDPHGPGGYDAIVILAHSQGTVITADLLRFLKAEGLQPRLPIYLFTMGCPLRQLYGLRFPHLYGWARHEASQRPGDKPEPDQLGVELWLNAYRSGDYVGRYLWHVDGPPPDAASSPWYVTEEPQAAGPQRNEFCIGSGAHTHYWDQTAPEIAQQLDRLVGLAASATATGTRRP